MGIEEAAAEAEDRALRLSVGVVGRAEDSGTVVDAVKGRFPDSACWALIDSMATTTGCVWLNLTAAPGVPEYVCAACSEAVKFGV